MKASKKTNIKAFTWVIFYSCNFLKIEKSNQDLEKIDEEDESWDNTNKQLQNESTKSLDINPKRAK